VSAPEKMGIDIMKSGEKVTIVTGAGCGFG
jgi:hypothetical protein